MSTGDARIYDVGYRAYDGPRRGAGWAMLTLGRHTLQRVLGLRRGFRHKLVPLLVILVAFVPAVATVSLAVLLPRSLLEEDLLVSYGEYFGFTLTASILFAAFVAPEALCTDRRTGMLDLYLAGPLDVPRYLAAKWGAVLGAVSVLTVGPLLFLLVATTIEDVGPSVADLPLLLLRIAASGLAVAALYAAVGLGISALTARKGVAAVSVVLVLFVPSIVAGVAVESAGAPDAIALASAPSVGAELPLRLFGEESDDESLERLSTWLVGGAWLAWVAAGALICGLAYRRLVRRR